MLLSTVFQRAARRPTVWEGVTGNRASARKRNCGLCYMHNMHMLHAHAHVVHVHAHVQWVVSGEVTVIEVGR